MNTRCSNCDDNVSYKEYINGKHFIDKRGRRVITYYFRCSNCDVVFEVNFNREKDNVYCKQIA